ncbi:MAG: CDP-alcohol phosphatidyltransferase family protein [Calditrichaeota bacterium]|nr:MAG: CDP-alcohol phosphatidyltransferase family protein [Calditrichota bacterium]MBL1205849.1 CDP-alcohol phosphatidyltransferase family protein [Calditrichota bacterium]NOG45676.1 CDP-alcohol phosphatidyltransferase family protein [Calditrichota bacterium]
MELITKKDFNLSNSLSFLRIILAAPAVYLIAINENGWLIALSFVGGFTDWADGFFARKLNQVSDLGKILDPIADKIHIGALVIALNYYQGFPLWLTLFIVIRDVFIVIGALLIYDKNKLITSSNWPGKISVTLIAVAIISFMAGWKLFFEYTIYLAIAAIIVSGVMYVKVFIASFDKKT